MSDNPVTRELGEKVGQHFGDSLISQLLNVAKQKGVRVSNLTTGDGYSQGPGSRYSGAGRPGSRHVGGGHEYHAPSEKPYHGEPVLGEDEAPTGDAAKALREGFKSAQDTESRVPHGKGTEAEARSDAVRAAMENPAEARQSLQLQGGGIDRGRFIKELEDNPAVARRIAEMVKGEVGSDAPLTTKQVQAETFFNRMLVQNKSAARGITPAYPQPGGYYPGSTFRNGRMSDAEYAEYKKTVIDPVLAGSHVSEDLLGFPATGNASNAPGNEVANHQFAGGTRGGWLPAYGKTREAYFLEHPAALKLPRLPQGEQASPTAINPANAAGGQSQFSRPPSNPDGTFDDDVFPSSGHITSTFGRRGNPFGGGGGEFHPGTDIGTRGVFGGPVRTPRGGTVVRAGPLGGYGNNVDIRREDGTIERYGHLLEVPRLKVGQQLQRGEEFGKVGSTGRSNGPHLHYERRDAGAT